MATNYFVNGEYTIVSNESAQTVLEHLPALTYTLCRVGMANKLMLRRCEDLQPVAKVYGHELGERRERVIKTFLSRTRNTGVLLTGEKGSGKTQLVKEVAHVLRCQHNVPVILINEHFDGEDFISFFSEITTPCLFVMDEFEKNFEKEEKKQEVMLTVLEGTATSRHLFMLTSNSGDVSEFLLNRPGRIFYNYNYESLDEDVVRAYGEERLTNLGHLDSLVQVAGMFSRFNFDLLQSIVEEMNRYGETAQTTVQHLNASPRNEFGTMYDVVVEMDGKPYPYSYSPEMTNRTPFMAQHDWEESQAPHPLSIYLKGPEDPYLTPAPGHIQLEVSYDDLVETAQGRQIYELEAASHFEKIWAEHAAGKSKARDRVRDADDTEGLKPVLRKFRVTLARRKHRRFFLS